MTSNKVDSIDFFPLRIRDIIDPSQFEYCKTKIADDDTAILEMPGGLLVITSDFINHRPAFFDLNCGDLYDYGYLVATANLSDLYSSGATPYAFSVGIRLLKEHTFDDYKRFMEGVKQCCYENEVPIVSGDTKIGKELCSFGTAIGYAPSLDNLFTRNNAKVGDVICISGEAGGFNCAVDELGKKATHYSATQKKLFMDALVRPRLDRRLSLELAEKKIANAGIDISDGLGSDLNKLARASNVGMKIEAESIPVPNWVRSVAERNRIPQWFYAFTTGGDFKFVFTAPRDDLDRVNAPFYPIGLVTANKNLTLKFSEGSEVTLPDIGHTDTGFKNFAEEIRFFLNVLGEKTNDADK